MNKSSTGKRLKAFRALRGLSQACIAEEVGVAPKTIVFYEREYRTVPLDFIIRVCRKYKVQPKEFGIYDIMLTGNYKIGGGKQ